MEQPEILQAAFAIERLFAALEALPAERVFDDSAVEAAQDAAFERIIKMLSEISSKYGKREMQRCAANLQFYMLGRNYHLAERAICFATGALE